jgi:hypothetical protein
MWATAWGRRQLILLLAELCADEGFAPPNRPRNIRWLHAALAHHAEELEQHATSSEKRRLRSLMRRIDCGGLLH